MEVANPTIEHAFEAFLAEVAPQNRERCQAIVDLLAGYLDGYAYESLSPSESEFWRTRWEEDEEANSFCRTFGPEKILSAVWPFLDWYVIRKVLGPDWISQAAGPVTSDLVDWLDRNGYTRGEDVGEARSRTAEASRDLPRADRLGTLLYEEAEKELAEPILEDRDLEDELITIVRVDTGSIWIETEEGEILGPVNLPPESAELAEPGWGTSAAHFVRTATGWRLIEIGNVYPNP